MLAVCPSSAVPAALMRQTKTEAKKMEKALLHFKRNAIPCRLERMCSGHETLYISAEGECSHAITSAVYSFLRKNPKYFVDPVNRIGYRVWIRADYEAAPRDLQ